MDTGFGHGHFRMVKMFSESPTTPTKHRASRSEIDGESLSGSPGAVTVVIVEALCFQGAKEWGATGKNWSLRGPRCRADCSA